MFNKAFLIFTGLVFSLQAAQALNPATLDIKLGQLTAPYGNQVGLTFINNKTGYRFSVNGSREFPAASVAKVPVMATAFHLSDLGKLDLNKKVHFKESDKLGGSGVLQWLKGSRDYTLWNLIRLMIVLSDNTATRLVVNTVSMEVVNNYSKSLGLTHTIIQDPTMLVEPPALNNNRTSPNDMANLLVRIKGPVGFSSKSTKEMLAFMRRQRYHWGIWRGVAPGTVIANKTGNLEGILNDVGIVYTKKGSYILSIFTQGFKKKREARLLINNISRIVYEEYTGEKVLAPQPTKTRSYRRPAIKHRKIIKRPVRHPAKQRAPKRQASYSI